MYKKHEIGIAWVKLDLIIIIDFWKQIFHWKFFLYQAFNWILFHYTGYQTTGDAKLLHYWSIARFYEHIVF